MNNKVQSSTHYKKLFSLQEVEQAIASLAQSLNIFLQEHDEVLLLCMMNGAIYFTGRLLPLLKHEKLQLSYLHLSRYGNSTQGGNIQQFFSPVTDMTGLSIVILDDVLDRGITLQQAYAYCQQHNAKEIFSAVMIDKINCRDVSGLPEADFTALSVEGDLFLVGSGLDHASYHRNKPGIWYLTTEK